MVMRFLGRVIDCPFLEGLLIGLWFDLPPKIPPLCYHIGSRACVGKTSFYSTLFKWQYMLAYECRKELQNGACLFGSARVWEYTENDGAQVDSNHRGFH